jgi:SAM-dependent methyltransferase
MSVRTSPPVNENRALWEKGDFTRIAETMRGSGEALVATLGITPGLDVLDLGSGDGTTAVPEAQLGANVLGVDIADNLVAAGNRRAQQFGLGDLRFRQGDASDLKDLANDSFDLVVSVFGAMFAPRPLDVAREVVRVTRPGGRIVMGNWIPNDLTFVAQLLRVSTAYSPPPPEGYVSPMSWGVEANVVERFGAAGIPVENITCERTLFLFESPRTPAEYLEDFRDFYGPTMNAYAAAAADGREADLHDELMALVDEHNTAEPGKGTRIEAAYLRVRVMV